MKTNSLTFLCPHCGQQLSASKSNEGAKVSCPACDGALLVPNPTRRTPSSRLGKPLLTVAALLMLATALALSYYYARSGRSDGHLTLSPTNSPAMLTGDHSTNAAPPPTPSATLEVAKPSPPHKETQPTAPQPEHLADAPQTSSPKSQKPSLPIPPEEPKTIIGSGKPHRPTVLAKDEDEKKHAAVWQQRIQTVTPEGFLSLINTNDSVAYESHIRAGLSPWIIELQAAKDGITNRCVPGSIIEVAYGALWEDPTPGDYTLSVPVLSPSWQPFSKPFGMNMWWRTSKGPIVIVKAGVLIRVPHDVQNGFMTLHAQSQAKGPPDDKPWIRKEDYPILIEAPPRPDRETLLSLWGYTILEAREETKYYNARNRRESRVAKQAIALLQHCAAKLDGDMQLLATELTAHTAFTDAVKVIEEGIKKDLIEAANPEKQP